MYLLLLINYFNCLTITYCYLTIYPLLTGIYFNHLYISFNLLLLLLLLANFLDLSAC